MHTRTYTHTNTHTQLQIFNIHKCFKDIYLDFHKDIWTLALSDETSDTILD